MAARGVSGCKGGLGLQAAASSPAQAAFSLPCTPSNKCVVMDPLADANTCLQSAGPHSSLPSLLQAITTGFAHKLARRLPRHNGEGGRSADGRKGTTLQLPAPLWACCTYARAGCSTHMLSHAQPSHTHRPPHARAHMQRAGYRTLGSGAVVGGGQLAQPHPSCSRCGRVRVIVCEGVEMALQALPPPPSCDAVGVSRSAEVHSPVCHPLCARASPVRHPEGLPPPPLPTPLAAWRRMRMGCCRSGLCTMSWCPPQGRT